MWATDDDSVLYDLATPYVSSSGYGLFIMKPVWLERNSFVLLCALDYGRADFPVCRLSGCIRESLTTNDEGGEEHDLAQNAPTKSPVQTKITDCLRKQ